MYSYSCWKNKSCNKYVGETHAYSKHDAALSPQTRGETQVGGVFTGGAAS